VFLRRGGQGGFIEILLSCSSLQLLNLEEAEEGGYVVTSPLNPELITQAENIEEAFANARDAAKALRQSRAKLMRRSSASKTRG